MRVDCGGAGWGGLFAAAFGAFFLWTAFMAWFRPNSRFIQSTNFERYPTEAEANRVAQFFGYTRESMGPTALWSTRLIGSIGGLLFFSIGVIVLIGEFTQCAHPNFAVHFPNFLTGIRFRYWPPMLPFIGVAIAIAIINSLSIRTVGFRLLSIVLFAAWAVAAAEAAAFHIGADANKWGVVCIVLFAGAAFVSWRGRRNTNDVRK